MSAKRQLRRRGTEDEPRFVIGMDAHSKALTVVATGDVPLDRVLAVAERTKGEA